MTTYFVRVRVFPLPYIKLITKKIDNQQLIPFIKSSERLDRRVKAVYPKGHKRPCCCFSSQGTREQSAFDSALSVKS